MMLSVIVVIGSMFFLFYFLRFIFSGNENTKQFDVESWKKASDESFAAAVERIVQDPNNKTEQYIKKLKESIEKEANVKQHEFEIEKEVPLRRMEMDENFDKEDFINKLTKEDITLFITNNLIKHVLNKVGDPSKLKIESLGYFILMNTINEYEEKANNEIKKYYNFQISDFDTKMIFLEASIKAKDAFW